MENIVAGGAKIIEREMQRARKAIPKGGNYNYYGDDSRQIGAKALGDHGTFTMARRKDVSKDDVCINGRVVYTIKHAVEICPYKNGII